MLLFLVLALTAACVTVGVIGATRYDGMSRFHYSQPLCPREVKPEPKHGHLARIAMIGEGIGAWTCNITRFTFL